MNVRMAGRADRPMLRIPKSFVQLQDLNTLLKKYRDVYPYRIFSRSLYPYPSPSSSIPRTLLTQFPPHSMLRDHLPIVREKSHRTHRPSPPRMHLT